MCDIDLPDGSGLDIVRTWRQRRRTPGRCIAINGLAMEKDEQRARAAGFDDYIVKPFPFESLLALLKAAYIPTARLADDQSSQRGQS